MRLLLQSIVSLASQWRRKTIIFMGRALLKRSKYGWFLICVFTYLSEFQRLLHENGQQICTFLVC